MTKKNKKQYIPHDMRNVSSGISLIRLSLLTMTNPNQLGNVLLFVCSKMADETNLSSKLPVAENQERSEIFGHMRTMKALIRLRGCAV